MVRINFESLTNAFNAWAGESVAVGRGEQMAVDGKSIKASISDYEQPYQDFVSVVCAFSVQSGMVAGLVPMHNGSESEISTVQDLLGRLNLSGVCFT
jgi:hypothetical protein